MKISKNLIQQIKEYFRRYSSGSARDVYFRLGKEFEYRTVCDALESLERAGYLFHKVVKATKYIRAHYVYYKSGIKKEPFIKELFMNLVNIVLQFF